MDSSSKSSTIIQLTIVFLLRGLDNRLGFCHDRRWQSDRPFWSSLLDFFRRSVSYALTGDFGKFPSGFPETTHVVQGHLIVVKRFPVSFTHFGLCLSTISLSAVAGTQDDYASIGLFQPLLSPFLLFRLFFTFPSCTIHRDCLLGRLLSAALICPMTSTTPSSSTTLSFEKSTTSRQRLLAGAQTRPDLLIRLSPTHSRFKLLGTRMSRPDLSAVPQQGRTSVQIQRLDHLVLLSQSPVYIHPPRRTTTTISPSPPNRLPRSTRLRLARRRRPSLPQILAGRRVGTRASFRLTSTSDGRSSRQRENDGIGPHLLRVDDALALRRL